MSLWTGLLVNSRRTRGVSEAVVLFIVVASAGLAIGARLDILSGAVVANLALTGGAALQVAWLAIRWRGVRRAMERKDAADARLRSAAAGRHRYRAVIREC